MTAGSRGGRRTALRRLREEAADCTDCPLYERATRTVFGEGPPDARLVMIGEQPGDREDRTGHPFVGPAGRLLDGALADAALERDRIYLTNAVKHFKWRADVRGRKVRIHDKPNAREVRACEQWWQRELAVLEPVGIVCLGAVAAQAVLGPSVRVTRDRGTFFDHPLAAWATVTVHPASVLRASDRAARLDAFVADLTAVRERLGASG